MIAEALKILGQYASRIPDSVIGPERIRFIVEHIDEINLEQKSLLVKFANEILTAMIERQASDIELGGHGTEEYVWLRIFGKKEKAVAITHIQNECNRFLGDNHSMHTTQ